MLNVLRRIAGIVAVGLLVSGSAPSLAQAAEHAMACCPETAPACAEVPALRCCTMSPASPATPATPTVSSPAGQRDEAGIPVVHVATPALDAAAAASRSFTARQRCLVQNPPHLRLCVLLI
jgi:hypothetical protein